MSTNLGMNVREEMRWDGRVYKQDVDVVAESRPITQTRGAKLNAQCSKCFIGFEARDHGMTPLRPSSFSRGDGQMAPICNGWAHKSACSGGTGTVGR